tara:strand:- start:1837 stop:2031 length:195 start_codon:yes stop_codon:yes gene_type:complete
LRKHVKSLKELLKFDIALKGDINEILDNPQEWAEKFAEEVILDNLDIYRKAKKMGEDFANEIKG